MAVWSLRMVPHARYSICTSHEWVSNLDKEANRAQSHSSHSHRERILYARRAINRTEHPVVVSESVDDATLRAVRARYEYVATGPDKWNTARHSANDFAGVTGHAGGPTGNDSGSSASDDSVGFADHSAHFVDADRAFGSRAAIDDDAGTDHTVTGADGTGVTLVDAAARTDDDFARTDHAISRADDTGAWTDDSVHAARKYDDRSACHITVSAWNAARHHVPLMRDADAR